MATIHGKNAEFTLDAQALTGFLSSVGIDFSADTAEATVFGNSWKQFNAGIKDATINGEGFYDPTATTGIDAVLWGALGASKAYVYYPGGNTSGQVSYGGNCIVTSYSPSSEVGSNVAVSFDAQNTGTVTRSAIA